MTKSFMESSEKMKSKDNLFDDGTDPFADLLKDDDQKKDNKDDDQKKDDQKKDD